MIEQGVRVVEASQQTFKSYALSAKHRVLEAGKSQGWESSKTSLLGGTKPVQGNESIELGGGTGGEGRRLQSPT